MYFLFFLKERLMYKKHYSTSITAGDIKDMDSSNKFDGECGLDELAKFFKESGCAENETQFTSLIHKASECKTKINLFYNMIVEKSKIPLKDLMNEEQFWEYYANKYKQIKVTTSKFVQVFMINLFMLANLSMFLFFL